MMKSISKLSLVVGALAAGAAYASGIELNVSSGASTDSVSGSSSVIFSSPNFNGWDISVIGGTSNSPSATPFGLDLTTFSATCTSKTGCSKNPLTVSISDIGFTSVVGHPGFSNTLTDLQTGIGSVTQTDSYGLSDAYFDTSGAIGSVTLMSTGVGSVSGGGPAGPAAYSLTVTDVLTAGSKGEVTFSLDGEVAAVPEPAALVLFGAGLIGCAIAIRRRQRNAV